MRLMYLICVCVCYLFFLGAYGIIAAFFSDGLSTSVVISNIGTNNGIER